MAVGPSPASFKHDHFAYTGRDGIAPPPRADRGKDEQGCRQSAERSWFKRLPPGIGGSSRGAAATTLHFAPWFLDHDKPRHALISSLQSPLAEQHPP
jgi:hypothetical protein